MLTTEFPYKSVFVLLLRVRMDIRLVSYEPTVRVSAETAAKVSCTLGFVQF